ncbi:hypothetical protein QCA50_010010, partial [Cerrena zonata]
MSEFDSDVPKIPDYTLSEKQFLLSKNLDNAGHREELVKELLESIKEKKLAPYYKYLTSELPEIVRFDQTLYSSLKNENEKQIAELNKKIKDAEEDDETKDEILPSTIRLAEYYTEIIDKQNAIATYKKALELTQSTGSKIDILLTLARIEFFFNDYPAVAKYLDQVKAQIDKGGDWER